MNHDAGLILRPSGGLSYPAPPLIAAAGRPAANRFVEFFTANIRNPNTRAAYVRAVLPFFAWCEAHGLALTAIEPTHVAAYVEVLGKNQKPPTVKQHLAAIRMLFDWLVVGHVLPFNPATSVRGPKHVVKQGKTPVLTADEARQLLDSIDTRKHRRPARPGPHRRHGLLVCAGLGRYRHAGGRLLPTGQTLLAFAATKKAASITSSPSTTRPRSTSTRTCTPPASPTKSTLRSFAALTRSDRLPSSP